MAFSLKDLLGDAVGRAQIGRAVAAAQVIQAADDFLQSVLPKGREGDAKVLSYRDGILTVGCKHGVTSQFVARQTEPLTDYVKKSVPQSDIRRVATRIMTSLPSSVIE